MDPNGKKVRGKVEVCHCPDGDVSMKEPPGGSTTQQAESPVPSCLSVKSDWSKEDPPDFSIKPGPSNAPERKKKKKDKLQCKNIPSDPVSTSCGHWFCSECLTSYSNTSGSSIDSPCPQWEERATTSTGLPTEVQVLAEHKLSLKRRYESVTEGTDGVDPRISLTRIYNELYIIEGQNQEAEGDHEVTRLEIVSRTQDPSIRCQDIFKVFSEEQKPIRVVLTNGVAGVGKTFSVLKFSLDWAEGLENQDLDLVVPLSFRELHLVQKERYSLLTLVQVFHLPLQKLTRETLVDSKLLIIFDGLDESRLPLDFNCEVISEVTQRAEVNVLLVNLIRGNLLPSALIWITSRPAAANQIPVWFVDRVTEVRGFFSDAQKEQYFTNRFSNEEMSTKIISHIRTSQTLRTMCQIPVFCWITATVLEHMVRNEQRDELPETLTDLYAHFLLVQTHRMRLKYKGGHKEELTEADGTLLLKLGRLAFEQLEKGNIMFYQEDLEQCGLDFTEALVYAGVCTEIFKRDCVTFNKPIYCFVHLSVQEFLAAVYLVHRYTNSDVLKWILRDESQKAPLDIFLKKVIKKSLKSKNGHLDLVARFLHGLSLESNLKLLQSLLGPVEIDAETKQKVIDNLKKMNIEEASADRNINLIHCLVEIKHHSVNQEIQEILKSKGKSRTGLSDIQCSALAYMLQMSDEVLDELHYYKYNMSEQGRERLIPAVRNCKKAVLDHKLSDANYKIVASALKSNPSHLRVLELDWINDSGLKILCSGLKSPLCKLETLKLRCDLLTDTSFSSLVSALKANSSHLRELSLNVNDLQDSGVELFSDFLRCPDCRLEKLGLVCCCLSKSSCSALMSALKSNPSHLRALDLDWNENLKDSGIKSLCDFLQIPDCRLERLRLSYCNLSEIGCSFLQSALMSNPSHMKELTLTGNKDLHNSGVEHLCDFLQSPHCRLEALRLDYCGLTESSCSSLASALKSNHSHLKELDLSGNTLKDSGVELLWGFLQSPDCRIKILSVKSCGLTEISCSSLASTLRSSPSHLKELRLSHNTHLKDSGVKHLCGFLQHPDCRLETLSLSYCSLTKISCSSLASALKSHPSPLKELTLDGNKLRDAGAEHLCGFLQSPNCRLDTLKMSHCRLSKTSYSSIISFLKTSPSSLKDLSMIGVKRVDSDEDSDDEEPEQIQDCHLHVTFLPNLKD